jgi:hypothetical protein
LIDVIPVGDNERVIERFVVVRSVISPEVQKQLAIHGCAAKVCSVMALHNFFQKRPVLIPISELSFLLLDPLTMPRFKLVDCVETIQDLGSISLQLDICQGHSPVIS